jgi:hypothetical protein
VLAPALGDASLGASAVAPLEERARSGVFTTLIYNVAGIPQFASDVEPATNDPLIGPFLNDYDLVLLQEDFIYHEELAAGVHLPYVSPDYPVPSSFMTLGDGLSRFSRFPMAEFERHEWSICSGLFSGMSDCTARKGFSFARMTLANGVTVDVYNMHLDAGSSEDDQEARTIQTSELIAGVLARSAGRAVIVAGDTNFRNSRPADVANFERLLAELDVTDTCVEARCARPGLDRILYRSGGGLSLRLHDYEVPTHFVDSEGLPLSDHLPVLVTFGWSSASDHVALE